MRRWWWVFLFFIGISAFYFQAAERKRRLLSQLTDRKGSLERELKEALLQKEDLEQRIASFDDVAWVELVLMRDLGVVPEGWLKVHFKR